MNYIRRVVWLSLALTGLLSCGSAREAQPRGSAESEVTKYAERNNFVGGNRYSSGKVVSVRTIFESPETKVGNVSFVQLHFEGISTSTGRKHHGFRYFCHYREETFHVDNLRSFETFLGVYFSDDDFEFDQESQRVILESFCRVFYSRAFRGLYEDPHLWENSLTVHSEPESEKEKTNQKIEELRYVTWSTEPSRWVFFVRSVHYATGLHVYKVELTYKDGEFDCKRTRVGGGEFL